MASVAKRVGFTTIDDNSGSIIMYSTPKDIKHSFDELKKEGTIDKIKTRYRNLQNKSKE